MKKIIFITLFFVILTGLYSQTYLMVKVNEPVYTFLDIAEVKGLISRLSQVRPYTKEQVREYLAQIDLKRNQLSDLERTVLDSFLNKYRTPDRSRSLDNVAKEGKLLKKYNSHEITYISITKMDLDIILQ